MDRLADITLEPVRDFISQFHQRQLCQFARPESFVNVMWVFEFSTNETLRLLLLNGSGFGVYSKEKSGRLCRQ